MDCDLPDSIQKSLGKSVEWFGPNRRHQNQFIIAGCVLIVIGIALVVIPIAFPIAVPAARPIYWMLGGVLLFMGFVVIVASRGSNPNGFATGEQGLARFWNGKWETAPWSEIDRVEDVSIREGISIEQYRIVFVNGHDWGFQCNHINEASKFVSRLQQKTRSR